MTENVLIDVLLLAWRDQRTGGENVLEDDPVLVAVIHKLDGGAGIILAGGNDDPVVPDLGNK